MTDRRKRQLQRIKKAHIWPSLVGIIIKITVMAFIMHILLLAYFENIVNMRLADANNTVRNAVDVMEATGNADSMSLLFRYRYLTGMIRSKTMI